MRSELIRIYKAVHTWTGILSGMALFIAFYAGGITLFKEQLVRWASPPSEGEEVALVDAQPTIVRMLEAHPEMARELEVNVAGGVTWKVLPEGADEHDVMSARTYEARGSKAVEVHPSQLANFIDVLHRVVGLPVDGDGPRLFMGVIATLYFLALFSGLVTLLPSLVKDLFALRVGPNLKRMWLDAHNVVGLGSFPFHLVMALTAATFAFHDGIYLVQNFAIHDGKLGAAFGARGGPPEQRDPATMVPPAQIVASVKELAPRFEPTLLRYMRVKGPNPSVFVFGRDPQGIEQRALGGMAIVEPYSGRIVSTAYLPGHQSGAETVLASFFALHFGSYGGKPVKLTYFLLALLGAWLVYSGNLLWIESRGRKQRKHTEGAVVQRRDTQRMASLTVGVCLGALCGISLMICSARWLPDPNAWYRTLYYVTFFAAIGWSFLRGGARASIELLRAAAALTLAIPLTSAVRGTQAIAVDVTALALGIAFLWIAHATARRVYYGRTDSVWSHPPIGDLPGITSRAS